MCILMCFKIQSDQPRIKQNALKSRIFDLFTKSSSGFYLCPDDDLENKSKIWLFRAFRVILGWSLWIVKYTKMHIGLVFNVFFSIVKIIK